jgi:hypothetical protein
VLADTSPNIFAQRNSFDSIAALRRHISIFGTEFHRGRTNTDLVPEYNFVTLLTRAVAVSPMRVNAYNRLPDLIAWIILPEDLLLQLLNKVHDFWATFAPCMTHATS